MEQVYKAAILNEIGEYILRISVLKAEIYNLNLEKELLLARRNETEPVEAEEKLFQLHF